MFIDILIVSVWWAAIGPLIGMMILSLAEQFESIAMKLEDSHVNRLFLILGGPLMWLFETIKHLKEAKNEN